MGKTLILCEKPSQAADFSKGLDENFKRENNYYESENYIICNARGHLIKLIDPEEYDKNLKKWEMDSLPIIPEEFKYKVEEDDRSALFKLISKQLNRKDVTKIVIATDAEREGELIARLILKMSGITQESGKEMFRFWTSGALDKAEIKRTMSNLKPLSSYDRLYKAAMARQQADWLIGINATRAATIKAGAGGGSGVISIGRVQTPTLYILALRLREINNFKPKTYYELEGAFTTHTGTFKGRLLDESGKINAFDTKPSLDDTVSLITGKECKIISAEKTKKATPPPKLYSLSGVQKEASEKYGIKAAETLETLQSLYDKKFTTYPRSGSEVLEEQMVSTAEKTLHALSFTGIDISRCKVEGTNKRIFNNKELTDHHAIIPTGTKPNGLSDMEQKIYDMVCKRFIVAFSPDYIYEATEIKTQVGDRYFKTTGNRTIDLGWKAVINISETEDTLPAVKKGDMAESKFVAVEKNTSAPKPYTDGSLISDMEAAHKFIKDDNLKQYLKENAGIGTPATQANIIETLIKRGYVERKGKNIITSPEGMKLIEQMESEQVCDPAYTAIWENALEDIAAGKADVNEFMASVIESTKYLVEGIKSKNFAGVSKVAPKESIGQCPVCGGEVFEFIKGYSCSNKDRCKFVLWKNKLAFAGIREIAKKDATAILRAYEENKGYEIKLKTKEGKPYSAKITLKEHPQYGWGVEIIRN